MEAIAACRHCNWGQKRDDREAVMELVDQHLETGHPVDVRFDDPDIDSPLEGDKGDGPLTHLEETGEFK